MAALARSGTLNQVTCPILAWKRTLQVSNPVNNLVKISNKSEAIMGMLIGNFNPYTLICQKKDKIKNAHEIKQYLYTMVFNLKFTRLTYFL